MTDEHRLRVRRPKRGPASAHERAELVTDAAIARLRAGEDIADISFDQIYPHRVRSRSSRYWTPVAIARRAATMLVGDRADRVLDIGSGAGKFCLVGALTTRAHFVGIEQRRHLVETARSTARYFGADRATYVHGDVGEIDWRQFDAFYCFNAFAENFFSIDECYDLSVELSPKRRNENLSRVTTERAPITEPLPMRTFFMILHSDVIQT